MQLLFVRKEKKLAHTFLPFNFYGYSYFSVELLREMKVTDRKIPLGVFLKSPTKRATQ
jgi:hypothetical protein